MRTLRTIPSLIILVLFCELPTAAQDTTEHTGSFFDDAPTKVFSPCTILIDGEVEHPGPVDLTPLPLHQLPWKEVYLDEKEFRPAVDLYVIVENDRGESVVLSWGELFYSKQCFSALISTSVTAINPSKLKTQWPLPDEPRLICGNDMLNARMLSNPTKITVKSFAGSFSKEKPASIYSKEIALSYDSKVTVLTDVPPSTEKRTVRSMGYGHGMGYKGFKSVEGYLLKQLMPLQQFPAEDLKSALVIISAKDGYRCVFSLSEIVNRTDSDDFLLVEKANADEDGRYALFATPDFFVDRGVRAVEKIAIVRMER